MERQLYQIAGGYARRTLLFMMCFFSCLQTGDSAICPESKTRCSNGCLDREGPALDEPKELCRCDPHCVIYDDCCEDYWTNCANDLSELRFNLMLHSKYFAYLGCISPIYTDISYNSFVVVDRCPPGWFIGTTRNRCENITLSRQEKVLTMFVNGPGDIVFKNVFCALCHGNEEHELRSWSVELWNCQPAAGETLLVVQGGKPDYDTCTEFRVQPPASMPHDPHRCYPGIIESCPPNTTAPVEQIQLCETRTSLLFERPGDAVYKNIHCLNCSNGSTGSVNEDNLACRPLSRRIRFDPRLSFTILFDFRLRGVHIVKNTWHGTERISSSPQLLRNCSQWQLYDPFRGVCRDIMCTDGQAPDEASGTCSTEQVEGTSIRLAKFLNDCPKDLKAINGEISKNNSSLWTVEDIKQADTSSGKRRHVSLNIYTNFARAGHIQSSLDLILSNVTDLVDLACNASSLVLVASNQPPNPPKGICEGYRLGNISFADIFFLDGAFNVNISGFVYDQHEFMHETEYVFDVGEAIVTKRESVTLCNPLVGDRGCSPITLYPEDFYRSIDGGALTEKDGGLLFIAGSYWLLPDGTARVCRVEWFHALAYVSYVGSSCSVTGLALALLTYITFPSLRNTPGKIVMNLMGALFVSQVFLMFVADPQSWLCELRGAMLHFSWLAVFSWMSVLACDLAYNLIFNLRPAQQARQGRLQDWKVLKLSIFAWGLPAAIVFSCLMATRFNRSSSIWFQYGGKTCWIVGTFQSVLAFGCPVTLAITLNFAMFGHLMHRMIANNRRLAALRVGQQTKTTILLCLKIGTVTGVSWIFFVLANAVREPALWYISVVTNSLQGALIAAIFLLKASVRALWRVRLVHACARMRYSCCCLCRRATTSKKASSDVREVCPAPVNLGQRCTSAQEEEQLPKQQPTALATNQIQEQQPKTPPP